MAAIHTCPSSPPDAHSLAKAERILYSHTLQPNEDQMYHVCPITHNIYYYCLLKTGTQVIHELLRASLSSITEWINIQSEDNWLTAL